MTAYVFWHRPFGHIEEVDYEAALTAFHRELGDRGASGFGGSATYRISETPWLDGRSGYEDWNFVESSAALDPLNARAVAPDMWDVHADIASKTDVGHGGIYYRIMGSGDPKEAPRAVWLTRPRGIRYERPLEGMIDGLSQPVSVWRKQMVLGPGYEFVVLGGASLSLTLPVGWAALVVDRARLDS